MIRSEWHCGAHTDMCPQRWIRSVSQFQNSSLILALEATLLFCVRFVSIHVFERRDSLKWSLLKISLSGKFEMHCMVRLSPSNVSFISPWVLHLWPIFSCIFSADAFGKSPFPWLSNVLYVASVLSNCKLLWETWCMFWAAIGNVKARSSSSSSPFTFSSSVSLTEFNSLSFCWRPTPSACQIQNC